jgi:uncharacterized protein YukE
MTINPLVAARLDAPADAWAGVWIAEDIELISQGVQNGSWIDLGLGVVGAGLDALAFVSDPVGALLQYGVAWLIEHVEPLREALDWLAGDPAQITAHAQTWRNVASSLADSATDLTAAVRADVADWQGSAATAYRTWATHQQQAIAGLARGADTVATITEAAGFLIAAVRLMVRDAIATLVSRLIVYAIEEVASVGFATPLVIEQATTLIASWAGKIATWLKQLIASLRRLSGLAHKLDELIAQLKKILNRLRGHGEAPKKPPRTRDTTAPSRTPDPNAKPRGTRTDAHPERLVDQPLRRENESADALTRNGYDVEQNPSPKPNGKKPDYKIEGEYFDNYAPTSGNLDQIRKGMSRKVSVGQADRLVLNLDDCPRSQSEIEGILRRKPIAELKEVIIVKNGRVIPFFPFSN